MAKFQEFCASFWVGKAKTEGEYLQQEEEKRDLPAAVGQVFKRMCDSFECPREQARYVDLETQTVADLVYASLPPLRFDPAKGCYRVGLEIRISEAPQGDHYPIWLGFEVLPLKHGGFELRFGATDFPVPVEEHALFEYVAEVVNQELRQGYAPPPRKIGRG
jgi:hypothetical protein